MRGFNPELGFHAFLDTIAYRLDVDPRELEGGEEKAAIRQIFDRCGKPAEAEAAVRPILERQKVT